MDIKNDFIDGLDNALGYDIQSFPWHSPRYVLDAFDWLLKKYNGLVVKEREFKSAREARAVAILLLGISKQQNQHYVMQVSREESPDIISLTLIERENKPVYALIQEVEVVTLNMHSKDIDVVNFLKRTKLSPKKSYDDKTVILCEIRKKMQLESYEIINKKLNKIQAKTDIFLLGKISPNKQIYQMCQVWRKLNMIYDIDVYRLGMNYPEPHNLMLTPGVSKKILIKKSDFPKPSYYEVFALNEEKIKSKFKT